METVTEKWSSLHVEHVTLSCGYVSRRETSNMTIRQMAVVADQRMYEHKKNYYRKKGIDRRGQQDAHIALGMLYTKILKIDISDDSYYIISMDESEKTEKKGFADTISKWLTDFGVSGQVHPDDLEEYLSKTNLEYMRDYFREGRSSLCVMYRRRIGEEYHKVMMEMIPANDYRPDAQKLFLYVKDIDR